MAENKQVITDKIMSQILEIRAGGRFNMFEVTNIRNEALINGFDELYEFLGEHKKQYCEFILTGKR
jgi:hypothetical protein